MNSNCPLRVAWLTNAPSGDQIDLLTAFAASPEVDLKVIYCSSHSVKGDIDACAPNGRGISLNGWQIPWPKGGFFLNPSIITTLTRSPCEVLIISGYAHPTMQLAMLVRVLQKKPWVLFAERPGLNKRNYWGRFARKLAMFMVRSANGVIATGHLAREAFALQLGPTANVFSLPYLIDHNDFLSIGRNHKVPSRTVSFMTCAELVPRKGLDVLIKAFQHAAQSNSDIGLTIVGDGTERQNLGASIKDEYRERITFRGAVPYSERAKVFAEADVFIHAARHDGWGVVIQEALAAGLPVIGTRQTGAAYDLVEDGKNGFLIDAEDVVTLAQRIIWFADHREEITRFRDQARATVARLTPEWGAAELVRITGLMVGNRRPKNT